MPEKLYVHIYQTTNKNYRARVAAVSGWTDVVGAPVRLHPLLAGSETVELLFERIRNLYPGVETPEGTILDAVKDVIHKDGAVMLVCRKVVRKNPPMEVDVRSAKMLSDLMRSIDAYAADYAAEGKLATARQDVELQLAQCLTESPNSVDYQTYKAESLLRRQHFIALREVLAYAKETGTDWMCLVDAQQSVDADTFGED